MLVQVDEIGPAPTNVDSGDWLRVARTSEVAADCPVDMQQERCLEVKRCAGASDFCEAGFGKTDTPSNYVAAWRTRDQEQVKIHCGEEARIA
jgi:hypothetical protein